MILYSKDEYEEIEERGYNSQSGYVCPECIEEKYLSEYIKENGEKDECSYCYEMTSVVPLETIIEMILSGLNAEYEDPVNSVGYCSQEGGYLLPVQDTQEVLIDHSIGWKVIEDISNSILYEQWIKHDPYSDERHVELLSIWGTFSHQVKHHIRYMFLQTDKKKLVNPDDGFYYVNEPTISEPHKILGYIGEEVSELGLIRSIPQGTVIYRARATKADQEFNCAKDLGAPPLEMAVYANRLSPKGISMFYGSLDDKTCVEEIKENCENEYCFIVSSWKTVKDINILDLADLPEIPSLFDEDNRWNRTPLIFLNEFMDDFSKPIIKDDREHIEYVPTQIVTEYFRHMYHIDHSDDIHGIFYPSSRCSGISCVLFCGSEGCCDKNEKMNESTLLRLI